MHQRIERIAGEPEFVGVEELCCREIVRLIRRVAEQVREDRADRPVQVDADGAREQRHFPDHGGWHVDQGVAGLRRGEAGPSLGTECRGAGGVEEQRVRVGDGGRLSHVGASVRHSADRR